MGSAAGGLRFNVAALPGASLVLIAALTALGVLLGLGLPQLLVRRDATQRNRAFGGTVIAHANDELLLNFNF